MADVHTNFAYSTVATAPSPATSGTSLVVAAGNGTLFPTVPFNATIWPTGVQPLASNAEIVRVTNISTDTLTIDRAEESTSARTVVVGDQIAATITALTLTDAEAANTLADVLTAGNVVGSPNGFVDADGGTVGVAVGGGFMNGGASAGGNQGSQAYTSPGDDSPAIGGVVGLIGGNGTGGSGAGGDAQVTAGDGASGKAGGMAWIQGGTGNAGATNPAYVDAEGGQAATHGRLVMQSNNSSGTTGQVLTNADNLYADWADPAVPALVYYYAGVH